MKFNTIRCNKRILNLISIVIVKILPIKSNIYIFLIKLYQYLYKNTKFNIILKDSILNDNYLSVEISRINKDFKLISLYFSTHILKNITTMKRMKNCMDYWIPLLIELSNKTKNKIYINLNCGDCGSSEYLSMDSEIREKLIPDLYTFITAEKVNKKNTPLSFDKFKEIWLRKQNKMYWRGSTTGNIYKDINELESLRRIKICKSFRKKENMDIKISRIIQNDPSITHIKKYLIKEQIYAPEVSENQFKNYKYYPDIPGNSLAWGTITKYLAGSLIFKPECEKKLYYYKLLKPWEHYIPVNHNFSDLEEKLIWSKNNITKSIEIAYSGYIVILEYLENIDNHFIHTLFKYMTNNDL